MVWREWRGGPCHRTAKVKNSLVARFEAHLQLVLESPGELLHELSIHGGQLGRNSNLQQLDCCFSSVLLFSLVPCSRNSSAITYDYDCRRSELGSHFGAQAGSSDNVTLRCQPNNVIAFASKIIHHVDEWEEWVCIDEYVRVCVVNENLWKMTNSLFWLNDYTFVLLFQCRVLPALKSGSMQKRQKANKRPILYYMAQFAMQCST